MPELFDPMTAAQKAAFLRAYLRHLQQHDGNIDQHRRFPRREAVIRAIVENPIALVAGPLVAQDTFDRNNHVGASEPALDSATLWALTTAKANLSERHAIDQQLVISAKRRIDPDDHQSYIDLEEHYHTRILADVLAAIGLTASFGPPALATRILISVMIRLPRAVANTVILAAELGGVVLFRLLLDKARSLFASEPKALARVEQLFAQILADEIGHVLFVRSRLGRWRLWLARRLVPVVARLYRHDVPEIDRLLGSDALLDGMKRVDLEAMRRFHPDPVAAEAMFTALGLDPIPAEPVARTGS